MKATLRQAKHSSITWLIFVLLLGSSGCVSGHTSPPLIGAPATEYVLTPGGYQVVGQVEGHASCAFLFFIDIPDAIVPARFNTGSIPLVSFALGDPSLRSRAMADLHSKVEIEGKRQVLHNMMEEMTIANYLGLFAILELTISAEVIEFTGSQSS